MVCIDPQVFNFTSEFKHISLLHLNHMILFVMIYIKLMLKKILCLLSVINYKKSLVNYKFICYYAYD